MAGTPKALAEIPNVPAGVGDLLSEALRRVRITGSMQYCFMPEGNWETDATPASYKPADSIGFHIIARGSCWLEFDGREWILEEGDIAAFPFGTPHRLGVGTGGRLIDPGADLPPKPWHEIPMLRYRERGEPVRILCGYIQCEAANFAPFRQALPKYIHVRTTGSQDGDWLAGTIVQIVAEVDKPQRGGTSVLERLTEVAFMEVLRRQFLRDDGVETGWLAAVRDPVLGRCLGLLHGDPRRDWTAETLAREAGLSRSALAGRFATVLGTSPIRYLRDWRLYLASIDLKLMSKPVGLVAYEAGYGAEAAFNRAFTRRFGIPPAEWRRGATK